MKQRKWRDVCINRGTHCTCELRYWQIVQLLLFRCFFSWNDGDSDPRKSTPNTFFFSCSEKKYMQSETPVHFQCRLAARLKVQYSHQVFSFLLFDYSSPQVELGEAI